MWEKLRINNQNIKVNNGNSILIACPHNSEYNNYVFWYPAKMTGFHEKYIEISFKDTFTFELKKYGQGKFNKYKLIDEKQVDAAVIEEMFDCMQTKDESYLIIKEPQKIDKHIEILEELKNDK